MTRVGAFNSRSKLAGSPRFIPATAVPSGTTARSPFALTKKQDLRAAEVLWADCVLRFAQSSPFGRLSFITEAAEPVFATHSQQKPKRML